MSAPSIPPLFSFRGGRGRGRGQSQNRGRRPQTVAAAAVPDPDPDSRPSASSPSHDATIQGTDTDAAVSRLSAVLAGYLEDPFAGCFVRPSSDSAVRRLPIINRGTYARTTAIDALVDDFLFCDNAPAPQKQIVSLGAGSDTRSLRLFSRPELPPLVYHEIDFPETCGRKLRTVEVTPLLRAILPGAAAVAAAAVAAGEEGRGDDGSHWTAEPRPGGRYQYFCHGVDLRNLPRADAAVLPGLRPDLPTLVISECCLCYLPAAEATAVLSWFLAGIRAPAGVVLYEPIRPDDAFGRVMVQNLAARHVHMPTLHAYPEPAHQEARLRGLGLDGGVGTATVEDVWAGCGGWVGQAERDRLDRLEGLDEVEEWKLLAGHYIIAWGWRGDGGFEAWRIGSGGQ